MLAKRMRADWSATMSTLMLVLLSLSLTDVAQASLVTFRFQGTIDYAHVPNPETVRNTPIFGSYSFESTTPDISHQDVPDDPLLGGYALSNLSVTVAGHTYTMIPSPGGIHDNDKPAIYVNNTSTRNAYSVSSMPIIRDVPFLAALAGPPLNGLVPMGFEMQLRYVLDPSSLDALPLVPPSISSISESDRTFRMEFYGKMDGIAEGSTSLGGVITSLTLAPVPVPAALLLFGSGVLGLAGVGVHRCLGKSMKE